MPSSERQPAVVVTGGTSGIGRAIAERLIRTGYVVFVTGRGVSPDASHPVSSPLYEIRADHREPARAASTVRDAVQAALDEQNLTLVGLVNNVGRRHNDLIGEIELTPLTETLTLNISAAILMTQALTPMLASEGGGSVVNISSRLAVSGMPGVSVYAATKAALNGFTVAAAAELAAQGIRVNSVAPGMTKTPLIDAWLNEQADPAAAERTQAGLVPLARLGTPADVAAAVTFLLSPDSGYITGTILPVDGGYTAV